MTLLVLLIKSDRLIWLDFSQHREKERKKEKKKKKDFNPESWGGGGGTFRHLKIRGGGGDVSPRPPRIDAHGVYWVFTFTDVYQSDMIIYVWGPTYIRHHPKDVTQFRTCV